MAFFKKVGTFVKGLAYTSSPYGIALVTTTGMINRAEFEMKGGKDFEEALSIAMAKGSAKYVSQDAISNFYAEMREILDSDDSNFMNIALGWCMVAYIDHVKLGKSWEVTDDESQRTVDGVIESIVKHWDDTFYLKRNIAAFPSDISQI